MYKRNLREMKMSTSTGKRYLNRYNVMTKWLSHYISFLFLLFYFSYQWTCERKVTHKEAQDIRTGLGLQFMYK